MFKKYIGLLFLMVGFSAGAMQQELRPFSKLKRITNNTNSDVYVSLGNGNGIYSAFVPVNIKPGFTSPDLDWMIAKNAELVIQSDSDRKLYSLKGRLAGSVLRINEKDGKLEVLEDGFNGDVKSTRLPSSVISVGQIVNETTLPAFVTLIMNNRSMGGLAIEPGIRKKEIVKATKKDAGLKLNPKSDIVKIEIGSDILEYRPQGGHEVVDIVIKPFENSGRLEIVPIAGAKKSD